MSSPAQSTWLGRYELLGTLGEGGYGTVYEALDRNTDERVALKELIHVNPTTLTRFKQEFRAVQELHHPNLVRLDALFEDRGKWVIAMELVEGADLLATLFTNDAQLGFEEEQLRQAFAQLADGLLALHEAGFVHRDLKPSNVRVTPEGRVVLLDFGLATALDGQGNNSRAVALGTVAYMAPEQAGSLRLGPAADWYAFGVCLYEALTGLLPIDADNPLALLVAKQSTLPPLASAHVPGIPADLDALCASLLSVDPKVRPDGPTVRNALGVSTLTGAAISGVAMPLTAAASTFEGRDQELGVLEQAFAQVCAGRQTIVLVEGDSGIGKSSLAEHFLESLEQQTSTPVTIFRSRCYENELLAYKAFDGTIDGLARILSQLGPGEAAELLPPRAALLCRVFPVLAGVKALSSMHLRGLAADPSVQRLEAFSLFARLLASLSQNRPIVMAIDDLQWADAESFRLLHTLQTSPTAARCFILATIRPRSELEGDTAQAISALRRSRSVINLPLEGLPRAHAWALARELMGPAIPDSWLDIVVRESAGHPLFLTVLARFAESHDPKSAAELTLDAAIAAHIGSLSSKARRLLEITALVGTPWPAHLCGRAAGSSEAELRRLIPELCYQKLLRRRRAGEIACFHDRMRRVVVELLPGSQRRQLHAQIAEVLGAHGDGDPAQLARHYEAAGEFARAYEAYRRAADKALSSLAFARAEALYQRALEVSVELKLAPAQRTALKVARGHALGRSGRSAEAAQQFLEAAQDATGEDKTRLRLWATQHLLMSARVEEGMKAARELLQELGVPLPGTTWGVVGRLVFDRAIIGVRGIELMQADGPIASLDRMRLDALWGIARPLEWLDPLASAALGSRHLRLARAIGEPTHVIRALADEAFARVVQNPEAPEVDTLVNRARELAKGNGDPSLEVMLAFREATVATFRWDLLRARERLEHAQRLGTENCPDQPWLLTHVRTNLGSIWANVGEHAQLASAIAAWLAEARENRDQFTLTMLEGLSFGSFRHLMQDDPDLAVRAITAELAPWPRQPFSFAHLGEMVSITYSELYRGGDGLVRWYNREATRVSRAMLLKFGFGKATLHMYRGLGYFAARAARGPSRGSRYIGEIKAELRELSTVESKMAEIIAASFESQLAAISGKDELALHKALEVVQRAGARGYGFSQHSHAYLAGQLEGGATGAKRKADALQFFADQGWRHPRRAVALLCPVLDELESR